MFSAPAHPRKALAMVAVCLGTFMLTIDVTIVIVALPSIHTALHTSISDEQWTIDAYSLSLAALLLPAGSLADILGRRRVFATGLALFTVSSLLCGIAGSGLEVVLFRALQGIGGAIVFATSLALLSQTFTGRQFAAMLGIWGAVITTGLGCAPVLGGLLAEVSWRLIFFVNLPVGATAIVMALLGVQEFRPPSSRRLDLAGSGVLIVGLVGLIYALTESGGEGWGSVPVITTLAVAALALASFPLIERRRRQPMFDLALLRKPTFVGALAAAFGMNGSLYAVLLYLVSYLQDGLHYTPLGTGVRLIVITGAATAVTIPAGRVSAHLPARWLIGPGLGLVGLGLLLMRGLGSGSSWTHLIVGMAVAGAGSGLVTPPLASTAVRVVPPADAGMASGVSSTFRQIGIAVSVAVLGGIFDARISGATKATLTARYASALNDVLLIAACVALAACALALVLIRSTDFHAVGQDAEGRQQLGAELVAALPSGSQLAISHPALDILPGPDPGDPVPPGGVSAYGGLARKP